MKYFTSILLFLLISTSCDSWSLEYRLQYEYTSSELDSLEKELKSSIYDYYEGSVIRQAKWDTLIAINPEREDYFRRKSNTHTRIGDYHIAFPLLEKALEKNSPEALYFVAWQLLYLYRDYDLALQYLNFYDDIVPGDIYIRGENIHYLKGLAYKQKGLLDEAVEEFDSCISVEKRNTDTYVYVYRGLANLRNECISSAIEDFDKALSKDPKCTMAKLYKAEALIYMDEFSLANELLVECCTLLEKGIKKTNPYIEVFDEVYQEQAEDLLDLIHNRDNTKSIGVERSI